MQWRARHRSVATALALVLAVGLGLAGCGGGGESPVLVAVDNYLADVGSGNYSAACALLDPAGRAELARATGGRRSCTAALRRCLPYNALAARQDQSQLLYADVQFHVRGRVADAEVSGTSVARMIKRVTLARHRRHWHLSSFARAPGRCRAHRPRRHRSHRARARSH